MPRNSGHLKCIYSLTHRRIWVRRLAGGVCEVCRRGFGRTRRARVRGSGDGKVVRHFSARGPRQAPTRAIRCRSPHAGKGCPGTRGIWSVYAHLLIDVYGCDDLLAACARCGGEVSAGPEGHVSRGSGDGKVVRHFSARGAPPASTRAIRCTSPRTRADAPKLGASWSVYTHLLIDVYGCDGLSLRWRRVRGVAARFRPDPKGTCPGER